MATVIAAQQVVCPSCGAQAILKFWSCGAQDYTLLVVEDVCCKKSGFLSSDTYYHSGHFRSCNQVRPFFANLGQTCGEGHGTSPHNVQHE